MRPTERVNGEETRGAVLADLLERYRAILRDPASMTRGAPGPDPISQWAAAEYDEGPSLAAIVELIGPLPAEAVAAVALEVIGQLGRLHADGSVHGELNPANLLLSDGGVRLVHSGVAHSIDGATLTDLRGNPRTIAYLTPEQILGHPIGPPTDVFALGGVLAYAAACMPAFGNDEPNAVLYRIVHEEAALDAVPDALRGLVKACLNKDPVQRPNLQTLADRACGVLSDAVAAQQSPGETVQSDAPDFADPEAQLPADSGIGETTAAYPPVFEAVPPQRIEPEPEYASQYEALYESASFDTSSFDTPQFDTAQFEAAPFEASMSADPRLDTVPDPAPGPAFESQYGPDVASPFDSRFESSFGPAATAAFPAATADPELTLTEVPLRDAFEPMAARRRPRYEAISDLTSQLTPRAAPTAPPADPARRSRRGRPRSAGIVVLTAVVTGGVIAALLLRGAGHSNPPAAAPPASVPVMPTAPLPGTLLTGPGCPTTAWATVTQQVAPSGGLVANVGGGAPDCGGAAIAFVKSGATKPGGSSFSWTFHPGWSARCTLSVFIADTAPSSGVATYQLLTPVSSPAAPATVTFKINQGDARGKWVSSPVLTDVSLPGGAVQLRLTDTGAYVGDTFHVTASAAKAVCSQAP